MRKNLLCWGLSVWIVIPGGKILAQNKYFPPDAVVDVTLAPYGAKPDDGVDDTAALQLAITDNVGTGRVLYFPAGIYDISGSLVARDKTGHWEAHLTLQGQGRDRTIFKLKDRCEGFGADSNPKAIVVTGSHWNEGDGDTGGGNKAFRNNILDLTLNTGSGNPGAIGLDYAVSNQGSVRNVLILSGDGAGVAGISMRRKIPGPGLIKNVEVKGFNTGIDTSGDGQYGMTLEHVTLSGQKVAGLRTDYNLLHIRGLVSQNQVPAVLATGAGSFVTLIDSQLKGGNSANAAILSEGNILLRNVKTEGYASAALRWRGKEISGPDFGLFTGPEIPGTDLAQTEGLLPVEETPQYWNNSPADWMAVGPRLKGESDDTAAIQRAFDSGKSTIYFPHSRAYHLSDTVVVRGRVKQILGMGSEITLGAAKEPFSDLANPRPLIRIDKTYHSQVFFEDMFFNAQYQGEVLFENNSPADVIIAQSMGWVGGGNSRHTYRNTEKATGKLFLEDLFLPGWDFKNQKVWARQLNPEDYESDGSSPQVSNRGSELWILGFKTEGAAPFIATAAGGKTELLGAYNYVSATEPEKVPEKAVPYSVEDGTAWLTFASDNFRKNDYDTYIRSGTGRSFLDLTGKEFFPRGGPGGDGCFAVPLYRSEKPPIKSD